MHLPIQEELDSRLRGAMVSATAPDGSIYAKRGSKKNYGGFFKGKRTLDLGDGIAAEMRPMGVNLLKVWVYDSTIEPYCTSNLSDLSPEPLGGEVVFCINTQLSTGKSELTGVAGNVVYSILVTGDPSWDRLQASLNERDFPNVERYRQGERDPTLNSFIIERSNTRSVYAEADHPEQALETALKGVKPFMLEMREWNRKRVNGEPGGEPEHCPLEKLEPRPAQPSQETHPGPRSERAAQSRRESAGRGA